jgi:hypothetical protein
MSKLELCESEAQFDSQITEPIWMTFGVFFIWYWGLNSGLHACWEGNLPLELCLQSNELFFIVVFTVH